MVEGREGIIDYPKLNKDGLFVYWNHVLTN
jgi:hypothetical protein